MKIYYILSILLLTVSSCSRINQKSRDYYNTKHIRHGVIPLSSSIVSRLDAASMARGKALYEQHCLSCHGENGQGNGPEASRQAKRPSNLQTLAKEVPNFKFFMSISQWQGDMPGWKDPLNDVDREDLVTYIKSFASHSLR